MQHDRVSPFAPHSCCRQNGSHSAASGNQGLPSRGSPRAGFGFGTHAALINSLSVQDGLKITASSETFVAYLKSKGFEADGNVIYKVAAFAGVAEVMADHPNLGYHGFGPNRPQFGETWKQSKDGFQDGRDDMVVSDLFAEAVLRASIFVRRIPKTKTIRRNCDSHWLKHIAEKMACTYPDGAHLGPAYVPSGALIAAAILNDFDCKWGLDQPHGYIHPQASFNMFYPAVLNLDCEIRPDGVRASDRKAKVNIRQRRRLGYVF